jgi:hypothetical protein
MEMDTFSERDGRDSEAGRESDEDSQNEAPSPQQVAAYDEEEQRDSEAESEKNDEDTEDSEEENEEEPEHGTEDAPVDGASPCDSRRRAELISKDLESLNILLPRLWEEKVQQTPPPCLQKFTSFVDSVGIGGCSLLSNPGLLAEGVGSLRLLRRDLYKKQLCSPPPPFQRGSADPGLQELQESVSFLLNVMAVKKTKTLVKKLREPRQEAAWLASLRLEEQISSLQTLSEEDTLDLLLQCWTTMSPTHKELEKLGWSPDPRSLLEEWVSGGKSVEGIASLRTWRCLRFTGAPAARHLTWTLTALENRNLEGTLLEEPRDLAAFMEDCWSLMGLTAREQELLGCTRLTAQLAVEWLQSGVAMSHLASWSRARFQ